MLDFASDYTTGCHPAVLRHLVETNTTAVAGYGEDIYCQAARDKIAVRVGCKAQDIFFLAGGTQVNQVVIDALLARGRCVLCPHTGHINCHEAGAIEYTGHKVVGLDCTDGKVDAATVQAYVRQYYADPAHAHVPQPGLVYISQPTEYGTLYSRDELAALYDVCLRYDMQLYIDGARLGYALAADPALGLDVLARYAHAFTIGGTKVGALLGEAVVFPGGAPVAFFSQIKMHGALLAKGRVVGVQFDALFTDDLYLSIGCHAVDLAMQLVRRLGALGYDLYLSSPTNQQFVILPDALLAPLAAQVKYTFWQRYSATQTVVRLVTGWSTTQQDIDDLVAIFASLRQ